MTIDVFGKVDRCTDLIDFSILIIDLRNRPIAILRKRNRACDPSICSSIHTPQIASEVESLDRSALRNQARVWNSPLDRFSLARVDVGGSESCGSLVLGGKPAFGGDDKGLGFLLIADLANEGGVVGEHKIRVHNLGVGWLKGERGSQLIGVNVAIGGGLADCERSSGDA